MSELTARATVELTVEISASGTWGEGCTVKQIREQATSEVLGKLDRLMGCELRTIGKPKVKTFVTCEK